MVCWAGRTTVSVDHWNFLCQYGSLAFRRSPRRLTMGQGPKGPRDLAGDSAIQICQDDDGNALFGVEGHVRVKPDVISIMLNHQVTVQVAYIQTTGIVAFEGR